ncbi:MAG: Na+/H+ antiporter subunit E [Pseudomonadota bacterium]|nr:Na+/H+ antiporter subunit E [Pseudomonadota bacterium]MDP1902869.1 Na+/H+ antiporter subunit E [Pseudomonadota bacterium]MDP2352154.1 Na+/H+ antiporter subunit E [Pseudomonadota bacterium]
MSRSLARALCLRGVLFVCLWWILTGRADAWGMGLVAVVPALTASLILLPPSDKRLAWRGLAGYLGFFLAQSTRGGVLVAIMALRPRPDLCPGVLEITLRLPDGAARVVLANTLNLLPGTLSVGLEGAHLRLHVLDTRRDMLAEVRVAERHVARMFGLRLAV